MKIFPSLISADLLNLEDVIASFEPYCDGFHLDVMDYHFVPNLTWGPAFVNAIALCTSKPLFIHLMVDNPQNLFNLFSLRPSDSVAFHIENKINHINLINFIREKKLRACLAINPKTPLEKIFSFLPHVDQLLLMSVEPGFSGQTFLKSSIERLQSINNYRISHNLSFEIVMDGGITTNIIKQLTSFGCNEVAIASAIFSHEDPIRALKELYAHE